VALTDSTSGRAFLVLSGLLWFACFVTACSTHGALQLVLAAIALLPIGLFALVLVFVIVVGLVQWVRLGTDGLEEWTNGR
jgi:hypothetical protein